MLNHYAVLVFIFTSVWLLVANVVDAIEQNTMTEAEYNEENLNLLLKLLPIIGPIQTLTSLYVGYQLIKQGLTQ